MKDRLPGIGGIMAGVLVLSGCSETARVEPSPNQNYHRYEVALDDSLLSIYGDPDDFTCYINKPPQEEQIEGKTTFTASGVVCEIDQVRDLVEDSGIVVDSQSVIMFFGEEQVEPLSN